MKYSIYELTFMIWQELIYWTKGLYCYRKLWRDSIYLVNWNVQLYHADFVKCVIHAQHDSGTRAVSDGVKRQVVHQVAQCWFTESPGGIKDYVGW